MTRAIALRDDTHGVVGGFVSGVARDDVRAAAATTAAAAALTLEVDRIRCDGYGICAELLPELIELDDWGYPIIRAGAVPRDLVGLARRAVDVCPVLALRLRALPPRG